MKTFLLNIPNSVKNWSNTLDAKTVLCSRSWLVFNDEGVRELYIFQKDGTVIASHNGKVTKAKWEYLPVNSSLMIDNPNGTTFLLNPTYYDEKVLALQVDGTNNFALMIGEQHVKELALESIEKVKLYIENRDEFDNQKKKAKDAEKAQEEARIKAWEKFVEDKVEEQMTPEILQKIKNNKIKMAVFSILAIISFIISIVSCIFQNEILITFAIFVFFFLCLYLTNLSSTDTRETIKYKVTKEYPLENFKI